MCRSNNMSAISLLIVKQFVFGLSQYQFRNKACVPSKLIESEGLVTPQPVQHRFRVVRIKVQIYVVNILLHYFCCCRLFSLQALTLHIASLDIRYSYGERQYSVKARGKIQVYEHYYKLFQISILFLSCETQYDAIEIFSGMA